MFQAVLHGGAMEALRFRKGDPDAECWGALIWSYNDCWGETGWSVIDHYLRRKASYYWLRRACAPVKIITRPRGDMLVTRIVNDTRRAFDAEVQHGWFRVDGADRRLVTRALTIPANSMVEVARVAISQELCPDKWLHGAVLTGDGIPADQAIWLLAPFRMLAPTTPQLTVKRSGDNITVSSPTYCHAVHAEDGGHALFSDNYFDLLPGVPYCIRASSPAIALRTVMPIE